MNPLEVLVIGAGASEQRLALAADLLDRCEGIVVLEGVGTLTPGPDAIECAVNEPVPGSSRCAEEYKVLVENASRALRSSKLGSHLPDRPLRWSVVDDDGTGIVELWRDT